ncbi:hypothetical protein MRQ36_27250 [Micromonospora sp. R77]|uniref:hypothetical protein n=1 Tax=Micromonospora sp. R77 TaxID=2925836 RepID=UPI001F6015C6|nr:hypothetical protein [Micromonospora sp. R77]MCI4066045.1 hypothetical protein [Micromonospora sp. R77]
MSYDLAVWEGDQPADDAQAETLFEQMYSRYIEDEYPTPPTPRIEDYVRTLLERWPDLTEDDDGRSPWSTGGLIDSASGPFVYFPMVYSRAREVSAGAARIAAEHGLVCFDPQQGRLRHASGGL